MIRYEIYQVRPNGTDILRAAGRLESYVDPDDGMMQYGLSEWMVLRNEVNDIGQRWRLFTDHVRLALKGGFGSWERIRHYNARGQLVYDSGKHWLDGMTVRSHRADTTAYRRSQRATP